MHLTVISCTPRIKKYSNTNKIINSFLKGFKKKGNTAKVYYLSERETWEEIRKAFYKENNILFAIPLYVECVPGIMLEFLETLTPKQYQGKEKRTKISFLLQGGFEEASQLRCGEAYLEKLPAYLNCDYGGTLIKGGMFVLRMMEEKDLGGRLEGFEKMGVIFAKKGRFVKEQVTEFAKPEYFSKPFILFYTLMIPVEKLLFRKFAKQFGCTESLSAKPYQKYVK